MRLLPTIPVQILPSKATFVVSSNLLVSFACGGEVYGRSIEPQGDGLAAAASAGGRILGWCSDGDHCNVIDLEAGDEHSK
jgi:hypothetical protein